MHLLDCFHGQSLKTALDHSTTDAESRARHFNFLFSAASIWLLQFVWVPSSKGIGVIFVISDLLSYDTVFFAVDHAPSDPGIAYVLHARFICAEPVVAIFEHQSRWLQAQIREVI